MQKDDGSGNFTNSTTDIQRLNNIFNWFSSTYENVASPSDPISGVVSLTDSKIRFELNGIYFYQNTAGWETYNPYTLLNIIENEDPSRLEQLNIFFTEGGSGWAHASLPSINNFDYNSFIVMLGVYNDGNTISDWASAGTLAHEMGHCLDLCHTYLGGGCPNSVADMVIDEEWFDDIFGLPYPGNAPHIANWYADAYDNTIPDGDKITNNVLGGNNTINYFSPKQIGKMHRALALKSVRRYVKNCPYSPIPLEITENETWDFNIKLYTDIIIKQGVTLTITCKVLMPDQAKIIIEPGAKLILDGGTLTNACGTMWQGIEVWGNRDIPQYPESNQGVVELKNGATIENARCAITTCQKDAEGNILWDYTGGIIHAKDAHFINNRKAIEFLSYHNILPNGREIDNSSYFNNCNFETNAQLSDPGTLPETFVSLNDVKGVKFLGCTFQNIAPTGVYSTIHRGNGITSIDANYEVKPLCLNPYIYPCSEYQPNTFKNLYYGIDASNTNPAITLTINGNNFDNNHRSIILKSINNATITKNNFDIGASIGNINDQTNEREECEACDVFNRS
ncbi:MAG: M43 family zinc metalloprotease, partial [Bacteroidales bacterium]|nr:M43 family zinc metalloprotease [Bacteroidales bacterium]